MKISERVPSAMQQWPSYYGNRTGHGFFIERRQKKVSCVGVDISEESIEYTRASLMSLGLGRSVELVNADVSRLKLENEFGAIILVKF